MPLDFLWIFLAEIDYLEQGYYYNCCILTLDRAVNQETKQVDPVEGIGISPWPVDVVGFGADAYAHRKQVDVKQLYNQVPLMAWVSLRLISSRQFESVPVQFQSQFSSV